MPIPFLAVCDLLEESSRLCRARKSSNPAVWSWFRRHRANIDAEDQEGLTALLSTLLPEKRTDRVYCLQTTSLEKVIGRALMLGASRMPELGAHRRPGVGLDLADCVERILTATPNPAASVAVCGGGVGVTVKEIDGLLHGLAARTRWSAPSIRRGQQQVGAREHEARGDLEDMYRRLSATEAKWFTRLVLKDYQPVLLDAHLICRSCDPVLPCVLKIRDDFTEALLAIAEMGRLRQGAAARMEAGRVLEAVKPRVGVKVGRQTWCKGRSIKHCVDLGGGRMSVERKMDGEYCQVHVDLSRRGRDRVQIFSKSGKDSTEDRKSVIPAIEKALRLDSRDCVFQKECILEGELVVYNDLGPCNAPRTILEYRNGLTVSDPSNLLNLDDISSHAESLARPKPYEHLMIVYYDIFLLDDRSLMNVRHSERIKLLEKVIQCETGTAALVQREIIDFDHALAASNLRRAFAKVIIDRGEGLVLKPDQPYIVVDAATGRASSCRCIKLKKEYIGSFGDVGDLAVVGAGFDAARARTMAHRVPPSPRWTHFYLGCLSNKEQVRRWAHRPAFTVVCVVELSETLLRSLAVGGRPSTTAVPRAENQATELVVPRGIEGAGLTEAFADPPVVDVRCFGFDRPGNVGFWTPRFPAVSRVHADRGWADVLSFGELQAMAREAGERPASEAEESAETLRWIARLEGADPRGVAVDAASQATATTERTQTQRSGKSGVGTRGSQSCSEGGSRVGAAKVSSCVVVETEEARGETSVVATVAATVAEEPLAGSGEGLWEEMVVSASSLKRTREKGVGGDGGGGLEEVSREEEVRRRRPEDVKKSWAGARSCNEKQQRRQVVVEIPSSDDDERDDDKQETVRTISSSGGVVPTLTPSPSETRQCSYAGAACVLRDRTVLLASAALPDDQPEMARLCADHGIVPSRMAPCVETWWETQTATGATDDDDDAIHELSPPPLLLLVDSVARGRETRALMARLDVARGPFRRRGGECISVYDWRVLRHVSVAEDGSVVKKYYDGFGDPWRRWYCGLV